MKTAVREIVKSVRCKRFKEKYLLFSVDDFGHVRNHSQTSRERLTSQGIKPVNKFDLLDALETKNDMEHLFEVLEKHKDQRGRSMVMTPYSLSANVDFERTLSAGTYVEEGVDKSFARLAQEQPQAYSGAWELWHEGQRAGLVEPQFHGKEHLNIAHLNEALKQGDPLLLAMLKEHSLVGWPQGYKGARKWSVAYSFDRTDETDGFIANVRDGLQRFEQVYGYKARAFTPPSQTFPPSLASQLPALGLEGLDSPMFSKRRDVDGKFHSSYAFNGLKDGKTGLYSVVRNAVFEPVQNAQSVSIAMKQVEWALRLGNVAHLSSHRLNFSGHLSEKNRVHGVGQLDVLLTAIKNKWPDIQFLSVANYLDRVRA